MSEIDKEKKAVIEFKDFGFQYFSQAEPTLSNINLTIYKGEKVLIAGASGSGKSTLGNCLNGLIPFAYKGEITGSLKIDGKETKESTIFELSKKVGTVLQDSDGQFIGLTVGEDIAFALENDCVAQSSMKETVQHAADIVDMGALLKSSPYELSGGQKQRAAIAAALAGDPVLLFADEPTTALDVITQAGILKLLNRLRRERNLAVLLVSHDLPMAASVASRMFVMKDGFILEEGTPAKVVRSPEHPYTRRLVEAAL